MFMKVKTILYFADTVFDQNTDNITIHEELCVPIIQSAMKGFHGKNTLIQIFHAS